MWFKLFSYLFVIVCVQYFLVMASQSVNSKACAQCEETFKKSQKSLNCQLCSHWFCLECSHVSVKLYEALKHEPTRNVPFNCDGCTRVLPRITELGNAIMKQNERIESCEKKLDSIKGTVEDVVQEKVENAIREFKEREDRKCNVIIHNVPEPRPESETKKEDDEKCLKEILSVVKCEDIEMSSFVRLGTPGGKTRLVKVTLGTVTDKHRILGGTKYLREKKKDEYVHNWSKVFITPDLTRDERALSIRLKKELERRRTEEGNPNLFISRGQIIERGGKANVVAAPCRTEVQVPANQGREQSGRGNSTTRHVTFQK